jgi:hypothetical protein
MVIEKIKIFVANHIRQIVKIIFIVVHVVNYLSMNSVLLCVLIETDAHHGRSCRSV